MGVSANTHLSIFVYGMGSWHHDQLQLRLSVTCLLILSRECKGTAMKRPLGCELCTQVGTSR